MASKNYAEIAKRKLKKPGAQEPHRILVYGRNKKGKTTFSASGPRTLVLDPERGTKELNSDGTLVWPVSEWADIDEAYQFLKTQDAQESFDWVSVDGLTRINNMALRYVMKQAEERDLERQPGFVQMRDYGKSGELMKGMLYNFHALPYGIVYTAQERQESSADFGVEDEDVESADIRYVPDLPKGVRSAVNGIVDVIGRIYTVKVTGTNKAGAEVTGTQRRLWIAPTENQDTGYRSKHRLPSYLKGPTVPRLLEMIEHGKVAK